MSTLVRSGWIRKLRDVASAVLVLAGLAYVVAKGISVMAAMIGPGSWGYVGAAGFLAVVSPLPFVLLGLFGRRGWLVMAVGALTTAVASVGVERHWSGWPAAAWLPAVLVSYLAVRAILSLPARMTRRRAVKLLRRQRGTGNTNAWSLRDWEMGLYPTRHSPGSRPSRLVPMASNRPAPRAAQDDTVVRGNMIHHSARAHHVVTHSDRDDCGTVVDSVNPAWAPDELAVTAPAPGMVKVRWSDSADPTQLYWEYLDELRAVRVEES